MLRSASFIPYLFKAFILSALLLIPVRSGAQSLPGQITIDEGGQIWIEGTAGPVDFSCRAKQLSGQGQINNTTNPKASVEEEGDVRISVILPVKSLDCGKRAMNNDMYDALKADKFPTITYQLLDASLVEGTNLSSNSWMDIQTRGIMEIGGVKDTTSVLVRGKIFAGNQFQVIGNKDIHMDTYNIDPPSKMFGLIRTSKDLSVHFDVTVTLENQNK